MKTLALAFALMLPSWSQKSETEVVVEPQRPPAIIPLEGIRRGTHIMLDVSAVSSSAFGVGMVDGRGGVVSNSLVCFRERVTRASAECVVQYDNSAIAVWDMRTLRVRTNKVKITLYVDE